ncbi:MAG: GMC family oxidoreductase, partial [Bdellovibrionales bacterium]|nr:GMC family oxidoreductase [Bdellovibrionales bacterium]
ESMIEADVCIIGSGAGGSPIAYELSKKGYRVVVLEKGKSYSTSDFNKDEVACCRRDLYTPNLKEEFHAIENKESSKDEWITAPSYESGPSFWNGNCVGGSSNFMSGFFHRLKPIDFRLLSEFGPIDGANVVDWPITYEDLEPYYTKVEHVVGISGRVTSHAALEPRSTPDYPLPPLRENIVSSLIDEAARALGFSPFPVARAILSEQRGNRGSCYYSNFCGSYGCSSGAKGSGRAALLDDAVRTGNCLILPEAQVFRLEMDQRNRVSFARYFDVDGNEKRVKAKQFVVACQAIESVRLLFLSANRFHPEGIGNRYQQLGKNLVFSAGGAGGGDFYFDELPEQLASSLKEPGWFVNRALQDWYTIDDKKFGQRAKGGTIDFLFEHANPIRRAMSAKWNGSKLLWGNELKEKLHKEFTQRRELRFEVFNDWLPTDDCFVSLDSHLRDKWSIPVAKVRLGYHPHDLKVGRYLTEKAKRVLRKMKLHNIRGSVSGAPPPNLIAGGCRFGTKPVTSYLDANCRVHDVDNLYVSDGSFMPTGGSVPYTWTIYANSFRVADKLLARM